MKITRFTPAALQVAVLSLRSGCPDLDETRLLRALRDFQPNTEKPKEHLLVEPGKMLRPVEVASRLNCSRMQVFRLMRAGILPRVKLGARSVRIPESALVRLEGEKTEEVKP